MRNVDMSVRELFVKIASATGKTVLTTGDINELCEAHGLKYPQWFTKDENNRIGRGKYRTPGVVVTEPEPELIDQAQLLKITPTTKVAGNRISNVVQVAHHVAVQVWHLRDKHGSFAVQLGIADHGRNHAALANPRLVANDEASAALDVVDGQGQRLYLLGRERFFEPLGAVLQAVAHIVVNVADTLAQV
jgi:hypothetical protein